MRSLYKVIHTASRPVWGDTEKRILKESLWMESRGHQVVIIAPDKSPLFLKAREKGIIVYPLSFQTLAQVGEYGRMKQIFINEKPFVVNCHGRADARIALKAAQKTGVSCRIMSRHTGGRLKNTWANKKLYKKLNHYVFTTAGDTTTHLQDLFGLSDMEIFSIPDGIVEPESLPPKNDARKELAKTLGVSPETRFIGILGGLPEESIIKNILREFKLATPAGAHHLVFPGDGKTGKKPAIAGQITDMNLGGKVHFHTHPEDSWALYRAYDCGIQPKGKEPYTGVPLEMLEAMYSSCPVIGSDSGGIRDILTHDETGLIFSQDSPEELSKMIRNTLDREAATLERVYTARKQIRKHHTMDAMGRDIIRIYRLHQVKLERRFLPC